MKGSAMDDELQELHKNAWDKVGDDVEWDPIPDDVTWDDFEADDDDEFLEEGD